MPYSKLLLSLFILSALLLTSCTKQSEETLWNTAKGKIEEANKLREQGNQAESNKLCNEAIELLKQYLTDYPSSQKVPDVYNSIAIIYMDNLMDYNNAVKYFSELSEKYPDSRFTKTAMFMTAYIYDEMIKDKNMAIESYQKFVDKYPEDKPGEQMSFHAKEILKMLRENRNIEDIIKSNTQNKDTTVKLLEDNKLKTDTSESKSTN
jgi:tetratricopeptide (TPR) repeat protein